MLLEDLAFVHPMDWWRRMDWKTPGIYFLTGGRQIGKSTSLKLLIKEKLLGQEFPPEKVFYLPCDPVDTHQELSRILRLFLDDLPDSKEPFLLLIDGVTYVKEWDRAIKALADEGRFRCGFCIITGSDSLILKEAMSRFPGRRGEAAQTSFCIRPLDFKEYVELTGAPGKELELLDFFQKYLQCGGHLKAINDLHQKGKVLEATHKTFEQWILGDFEKRGKSAEYLKKIFKTILETTGTQITYSSLTQRIGEISKPTFLEYCELLERLDILFSLEAFDQNSRLGFPKKARKLHFWDPFIFETVRQWLECERLLTSAVDWEPIKVESVVAAHFKKRGPAYYWKGKGEIDVVSVAGNEVWFVEVKWTRQVRSWDLEELKKQKNRALLTRLAGGGAAEGVPIHFLPAYLLNNP